MKWSLHSDLHIESNGKTLDTEQADAFVLAGDIGEGWDGVAWAESWNKPVIYVPGNHEYYHQEYFACLAAFQRHAHPNVHILHNSAVVVDGVRWIGSTLWTNWAKGHPRLSQHAWGVTNDAREIQASAWWDHAPESIHALHAKLPPNIGQASQNGWNPLLAIQQHREAVRELQRLWRVPFDGPTVVVTHHAPLYETLLEAGIAPDLLNPSFWDHGLYNKTMVHRAALYASDLSDLVKDAGEHGVRLWVHGHVHAPVDYLFGKVRVMSNPKGHRIRGKVKSAIVQAKPYQAQCSIDPHKPARSYFDALRAAMAETIDEEGTHLEQLSACSSLFEPNMQHLLQVYVDNSKNTVAKTVMTYVNSVEQWAGAIKSTSVEQALAKYQMMWPTDYQGWRAFLPILRAWVTSERA